MKNYKIEKDKVMFLFIDVQDGLYKAMKDREEVLKVTKTMAEGAEVLQIEGIMTTQYKKGLGEANEVLQNRNFKEIDKITFSCMENEEFSKYVKESGKTQFVILGSETHICVFQTARDMIKSGYEVFIVSDGVTSRDRKNYENALLMLNDMGCVVTNSESVLFDITHVAGTNEFKQISKLVK